jgi:IS605 OrfB family transposase
MLLVYRYRIKSLTGLLHSQARACNFVWNFCNDTQLQALKWNKRWPSGFDLNRLTAGSSKELALHAGAINAVCEQYAKSRRQKNRPFLRWRGKIENPRLLERLADKLATVQRAGKKRQATNLHARIGNARRDFHHQLSIRIVREFDYIAVGNVNAAGLAKTRLAKSVLDAGWSSFRSMLRYKAIAHGAWYEEVNESFSSRVCSSCASETGPKGVAELGIRSWICAQCGVSHDRDINSARNILFRSGHRTPAEGIRAL